MVKVTLNITNQIFLKIKNSIFLTCDQIFFVFGLTILKLFAGGDARRHHHRDRRSAGALLLERPEPEDLRDRPLPAEDRSQRGRQACQGHQSAPQELVPAHRPRVVQSWKVLGKSGPDRRSLSEESDDAAW